MATGIAPEATLAAVALGRTGGGLASRAARPAGERPEAAGAAAPPAPREPAGARRDLLFRVDEASGRVVIQVVDGESGEVLRQIPPEELLAMARLLRAQPGFVLATEA